MKEDRIRQALEHLNPSTEQENKMWIRLMDSQNSKQAKRVWPQSIRRIAAVVILAVLIVVAGVGVKAFIQNTSNTSIGKKLCMSESEILEKAEHFTTDGTGGVFAAEIFYLDEQYLLFGNLRGIVIYNREKNVVSGTIDTQSIGGIYLEGEWGGEKANVRTCVVLDSGVVTIFNVKGNSLQGEMYQIAIDEKGLPGTKLEDIGHNKEVFESLYQKWKSDRKQYVDTFDQFHTNDYMDFLFDNPKLNFTFSEYSKKWNDEEGTMKVSVLVIWEEQYVLYTYCPDTKEVQEQKVNLPEPETDSLEKLPGFVYTGNEPYMETVIDYFRKNPLDVDEGDVDGDGNSVWIPEFMIVKSVKKEGEVVLFGNFESHYYIKTGYVMESSGGGGDRLCRIHLKKQDENFKVTRVDQPRDGAYYHIDLKKFTKAYPGLYKEWMEKVEKDNQTEKSRKQFLRMYLDENSLDIRYFKDFGWPVEKF